MKEHILETLSQITPEEEYILFTEVPTVHQSLYAKTGRFLVERRHISHIAFGESTAAICIRPHPRFRAFPTHSHDYIEMMYVFNGTITHAFDQTEVCLQTNDLILMGRNARHSILETGQDDIGINLIVSCDLFESLVHSIRSNSQLPVTILEGLLEENGMPFCVFHGAESLAVRNLLESMIDAVICQKKIDGFVLQQSLHLLLCYVSSLSTAISVSDSDKAEEQLKKKIRNYLRTSYSTATLTEAADMLGLSPPYLSRIIRKSFGVSFKELLMAERFDLARELLCTTKLPIGEILHQIGYENSSYFHKEFKRRYGMPPMAYRKSNRINH